MVERGGHASSNFGKKLHKARLTDARSSPCFEPPKKVDGSLENKITRHWYQKGWIMLENGTSRSKHNIKKYSV